MFPFLSTPTLYSPCSPPSHPACVLVCSRFLDLSNWEMERKSLLDEEVTSRLGRSRDLSMPRDELYMVASGHLLNWFSIRVNDLLVQSARKARQ